MARYRDGAATKSVLGVLGMAEGFFEEVLEAGNLKEAGQKRVRQPLAVKDELGPRLMEILDGRILTKSYGKSFLQMLPECEVQILEIED